MARMRRNQQWATELRASGMTLAQVQRSQDKARRSGLVLLVALALFVVAGLSGGYMILQSGTGLDNSAETALPVISAAPSPADPANPSDDASPAVTAAAPAQPAEIVLTSLSVDAATGREAREVLQPAEALPATPLAIPAPAETPLEVATGPVEDPNACMAPLGRAASNLVLRFDAYSVTLDDTAFEPVFALADALEDCPQARLVIEGHADPTGDETQNLLLSWQRAENVLSSLLSAGYGAERFEVIGYGSRRLAATGDSDEAKAENRRVAFAIVLADTE